MATIRMKGLEEYISKLEKLSGNTDIAMERTLYQGAKVLADSVKEALQNIPEHAPGEWGTPEKKISGLTKKEKNAVIASFGLAPMQHDTIKGTLNTKLGFDGYGPATKKYPQGVPNSMLIRAVESGTSFRKKTPVIRPAVNRSKESAIQKMEKALDEEIRRIM